VSDNIKPIRPDVCPEPDKVREFLDFTRDLLLKQGDGLCAIAVVVHCADGSMGSGTYSIPDMPTNWIAAASAVRMAAIAERSGEEG